MRQWFAKSTERANVSADELSQKTPVQAIGPGVVVLVVGPSGVGKDAILSGARVRLKNQSRFWFPERVISRPPHGSEKHVAVTPDAFERARLNGQFALSWFAHGVGYGLPGEIKDRVGEGDVVVCNASRTVVGFARKRYSNCSVVYVDCPVDVRAERLARRGRETPSEITERLERDGSQVTPETADVVIDNSGPVEFAIEAFVSALQAVARCR